MRRFVAWAICLLSLLTAALSSHAGYMVAPLVVTDPVTSVSAATTSAMAKPSANLLAKPALAQDTYPPSSDIVRFGRLSVEQGLSHSTVTSILQDRYGFMWFGTQDGLNKYDGNRFTVYRHDPENPHTIGDNLITALYEDTRGTLWVGMERGGLDSFERDSGRFIHYRHDPQDPPAWETTP